MIINNVSVVNFMMMKKCTVILLTAFILYGCSSDKNAESNNEFYSYMKEEFSNPPSKAHPKVYWWWLNGWTDTVRIREELRAMKEIGISGFDIFEIGAGRSNPMEMSGPAFLSDESLIAIKRALDEAEKLEMEAGLNVASSWNAGGSWITPEHAAKSIYFSKMRVTENIKPPIKLSYPVIPVKDTGGQPLMISFTASGRPVYSKEIAVIAIPVKETAQKADTSQIIDLTGFFNPVNEELNWHPLPGDWYIYRFVCSNSGEQLKLPSKNSAGPIIDHFDSSATEFHFNYLIDRLKTIITDFKKSALKSLYLASYEATGFVWSPSLPDEFRRINGYDIRKFLPALFEPDLYQSKVFEKFNADFRRTLSEMMINNFYRKAKEIANRNGLMINSEAGGPGLPLHNVPVEPLKALGSLDLPRGEFWIDHHRYNNEGIDIMRVVKEVSAASHIYNRGIVEEESFTSFHHWQEGPGDMKPWGDRAFCEGMNRVVIHGFAHNPRGTGFPGIVYSAGTHFNDKRIWWPMAKPFIDYLSRISFILQESSFKADVLYYYGDRIPNYAGHKKSRFSAGQGYDYEVINTEKLLNLSVKNGKLILPEGVEFSLLALENEGEINAEVLEKLYSLVKEGAVVAGVKPLSVTRIPENRNEREYINILDKLWPENSTGKLSLHKKERVIDDSSPEEILNGLNIMPDFRCSGNDFDILDYIHYSKNDIDFYFVRNTTDRWISRNCSFRQRSKKPEIWDPVTGDISRVMIYRESQGYTIMPLTFAPFESYFVVFKDSPGTAPYSEIKGNESEPPLLKYSDNDIIILDEGNFELAGRENLKFKNVIYEQEIKGAWEIFFPLGEEKPSRIIFPRLVSWTESEIEDIKYFSGIATYKKNFHYDINFLRKGEFRFFLEFEDISKVGDVWLNGKHLGIAWTKPFRFEVTDALKPGNNTLVVNVANTWSNRLKGDALTGKKNTYTNIKITSIGGLDNIYATWAEVPLIKSGLIGKARIYAIKPVK